MSESVNIVRSLAFRGLTKKEIASESGISYNRVTEICRDHEIVTVKRRTPKKKTHLAPREQQIIDLRNTGMTYSAISKEIGISIHYIGTVCRKYGKGNSQAQQTNDIETVRRTIKETGFEYVGGYQNSGHNVKVRCPVCHGEFERLYHIFTAVAHNTWISGPAPGCPVCKAKKIEEQRRVAMQAKHDAQEAKKEQKAKLKAERDSRKANDELAKRLAIHVCQTCGRDFCIAVTGYNSFKYCSEYCQTNKYRKQHDSRRIKRMYGRAHDNDITLKKLYKRDKGKCYLCGRECDWNDSTKQNGTYIAGPTHPSIDHVVPLSKGGLHTWDNVKLACMCCNASKSDKV